MNKKQYNLIKFTRIPVVFILFQMTLTGCYYSKNAFRKVEPPISLVEYQDVYMSEKNELNFQIKVRSKVEKHYEPKYEAKKGEFIWCAKLPLQEILNYAVIVDKTIPPNSSEGRAFYEKLDAVPASAYELVKLNCINSQNPIVQQEYIYGNIGELVLSPPMIHTKDGGWNNRYYKDAPVRFIKPRLVVRKDEFGYIILKTDDGNYKVIKVELPLPDKVYDKKNIALLPVYFIADIVTFPYRLLVGLLLSP